MFRGHNISTLYHSEVAVATACASLANFCQYLWISNHSNFSSSIEPLIPVLGFTRFGWFQEASDCIQLSTLSGLLQQMYQQLLRQPQRLQLQHKQSSSNSSNISFLYSTGIAKICESTADKASSCEATLSFELSRVLCFYHWEYSIILWITPWKTSESVTKCICVPVKVCVPVWLSVFLCAWLSVDLSV